MPDIDDEALEWVARQAAGPLDEAGRAAFETWYAAGPRHQGAYLRARAIGHALDQIALQDNQKPDLAARRDDWDLAAVRDGSTRRKRRTLLWSGALAAGVAALAATGLHTQIDGGGRTVLQTAKGEFRKVPLADRSVVSINSASQVEVDITAAERRIFLERGEAWFEVAKDKARPFIVAVGDVRVRAVGTAFAVRRHAGGADVLVTEGVVEVWNGAAGAGRQRMPAGRHAFVGNAAAEIRIERDAGEVARRLAWREGQLAFHNAPLASAVADFNRYNVRQLVIVDPALRRRPLVGNYRIDQPEQFADDLRALWNVPVAVAGDSIRIGAAPRAAARRAAAGG